ncbi:hypothetical protein pdam_00014256 [Pocillopora damicornis]|uniref:Uncharacterized protein n=1 Tax=Pocillopora damicornis TaxID=46731 RepID=A0A3M6UJ57_POCDA|nr:hypothetical protein pdam_00014256 [Pocillopora damicornis]
MVRSCILMSFLWTISTAGLVNECNFDGEVTKAAALQNLSFISSSSSVMFSRTLPSTRTSSHSCIVTTEDKDSFLYVKAKTSGEKNGTLHMTVYGEDELSSSGHLDTAVSHVWSTSISCPKPPGQKYSVLLTGTPSLSYAVEISENVSSIDIGQPKSFTISSTQPAAFQFKPSTGISKKQLDITVESSINITAYLKVSHTCEDVVRNINALNHRSLRLSFAEKGRITLSKASSPPLEDTGCPWFIGIAIKSNKSETREKNVTLTLASSFDYDYATPFYFLIFLSFFGGIAVALWALFCFREPYKLAMEDEHIDDSAVSFSSPMAASHRMKDNLKSLFSSCWKKKEDEEADELRPLIRGKKEKNPLTWKELFKAMKIVLFTHWFAQGPKTFSYTTCIVVPLLIFNYFGSLLYEHRDEMGLAMKFIFVVCLVFYYIGILSWVVHFGIQFDFPDMFLFSCISACLLAITGKVLIQFFRTTRRCCTFQTFIFRFFQYVFEDWPEMIHTGGRDRCYYNEFCYRVGGYDIPFNLMISDLVYMIHGLILAWSFAWCHKQARRNHLSTVRLPPGQVELPKHILKCPNINGHLAKMTVPYFQLNNLEEEIMLHAEAHKRKFTFSIGYALACGLIFEGCFSMLYHFYPTKLTFQFDTAFMFVISGLIVLSLYNGISFKECVVGKRCKKPVQANNFSSSF